MNIFIFIIICALVALAPTLLAAAVFAAAFRDGERFRRAPLSPALLDALVRQPCIRPRHA